LPEAVRPERALDFSGRNSRPESQHGYRFREGKGCATQNYWFLGHASLRDLKAIYRHSQAHRDVFPHVRHDSLRRRVEAHQCIWRDGIVITYQQYNKRTAVGKAVASNLLHIYLDVRIW
jgi:hypothetical protein